jgi:CBS domain-containing membrane protein
MGSLRTLKMRWRIWRARFSTPALLARFDERKTVSWIAAVNGGLAILIITLTAWLSNSPLVFPALGPSAFILFTAPLSTAAAPRSVILGHFTAMASSFVIWNSVSYLNGAPVSLEASGWPLLSSTSLALAVICLLLVRLSCPHAPACASSMVVAMGGVPNWSDLLCMAFAVVLITVQAVAMNRLAGLPVPTWAPRRHESQ